MQMLLLLLGSSSFLELLADEGGSL